MQNMGFLLNLEHKTIDTQLYAEQNSQKAFQTFVSDMIKKVFQNNSLPNA